MHTTMPKIMAAHSAPLSPRPPGRQRPARRISAAFRSCSSLVLGYSVVELIGGVLTGSLALLSDALHMVADSAAFALSLLAGFLAARPAHKRRTFGNSRVEILAALANGVALAVVALFISVNALRALLRLRATSPGRDSSPWRQGASP